ncbi:MAG: hypothetical protein WDW38_004751 [Sanguina aurantia]
MNTVAAAAAAVSICSTACRATTVRSHYHANLTADERSTVQRKWSNGDISLIVATIAFGMGIDKHDVRFVIHYSLPKSLEGYHQETGRGGRDGQEAHCVLFYSYSDAQKMRSMLQESSKESMALAVGKLHGFDKIRAAEAAAKEQLGANMDSLNTMISFAEETVECRRVQLLQYFGETFDSSNCNKTCDVCRSCSGTVHESRDVSPLSLELLDLVTATHSAFSLNHVVDVFYGSMTKTVKQHGHETLAGHGAGRALGKADLLRLARRLVVMNILQEETTRKGNSFNEFTTLSSHVVVNHTEARKLHSGQLKVLLPFVSNSGGAAGKGAKAVAAASRRASKDSSGTGQDAPPTQVGGVASSDAATWRHVAFGCIGHGKAPRKRQPVASARDHDHDHDHDIAGDAYNAEEEEECDLISDDDDDGAASVAYGEEREAERRGRAANGAPSQAPAPAKVVPKMLRGSAKDAFEQLGTWMANHMNVNRETIMQPVAFEALSRAIPTTEEEWNETAIEGMTDSKRKQPASASVLSILPPCPPGWRGPHSCSFTAWFGIFFISVGQQIMEHWAKVVSKEIGIETDFVLDTSTLPKGASAPADGGEDVMEVDPQGQPVRTGDPSAAKKRNSSGAHTFEQYKMHSPSGGAASPLAAGAVAARQSLSQQPGPSRLAQQPAATHAYQQGQPSHNNTSHHLVTSQQMPDWGAGDGVVQQGGAGQETWPGQARQQQAVGQSSNGAVKPQPAHQGQGQRQAVPDASWGAAPVNRSQGVVRGRSHAVGAPGSALPGTEGGA